jgi:ATP-dependent RNA helicase DeaD
VEWVLEQLPEERQIALFSATMPPEVRRIAQKHLNEPAEVTIKSKTSTAANIRQRYWIVGGLHKLDALTRILEVEPFDGMLVFTRTKLTTSELAEKLEARGFAVEALHGDIAQAQRERTVARLKAGQIDIVVATDVAARGLDVERISHVINYDVPHDPESYIHRIGRTGRAGRSGEAILFIAPRERNMLRVIERATRQSVTQMELPTTADVNEQRVKRFNERIQAVITAGEAEPYRAIIERFEAENTTSAVEIAAALAFIAQGKKPLLLDATDTHKSSHGSRHESKTDQAWGTESSSKHKSRKERREGRGPSGEPGYSNGRSDFKPRDDERPVARDNRIAQDNTDFDSNARVHGHLGSDDGERGDSGSHVASLSPFGDSGSGAASPPPFGDSKRNSAARSDDNGRDSDGARYMGGRDSEVMETYRVEVGREHGVAPSNILGAIANEAELPGKRIGRIVIREDHSFVDLPTGMPKEVFLKLQKVVVSGQKLRISRALKAHVQQLRGGDRYQKGKKSARY